MFLSIICKPIDRIVAIVKGGREGMLWGKSIADADDKRSAIDAICIGFEERIVASLLMLAKTQYYLCC